jgi:hypothetical protein
MPDDVTSIKKALRRLEGAEVKVVCRAGDVCKIPAQVVKMQERDGIITTHEITADITE